MISKGVRFCGTSLQKTGMFRGCEVSDQKTYSARDWLSILRTPNLTQNLQRKLIGRVITVNNTTMYI
jgi:hypothetical protein